MITGIEHIAIRSNDTTALRDFYVRVLGMKTVFDNGKGVYFVAAPDKSMLELVPTDKKLPTPAPDDTGIRHLAVTVQSEDFDDAVARLKAENVEVVAEPVNDGGVKTFFFRDIDGNVFHLMVRPVPFV